MKKRLPLILPVFAILVFLLAPLFIKTRISCKTQYGTCPQEISGGLFKFSGKNIYSSRSGIRAFLKKNPLVSDFSIQFKLPDVMSVDIIIRKPLYSLKDSNSSKIALIGENGTIVSITDNSNLPQVIISGSLPELGTRVEDKIFSALKIEYGIYQIYQIQEARYDNETLLVELPGQIRVIFPLDGDTQTLLGSVRLIYSKIQNDATYSNYKEIDLRFKNPVLR